MLMSPLKSTAIRGKRTQITETLKEPIAFTPQYWGQYNKGEGMQQKNEEWEESQAVSSL